MDDRSDPYEWNVEDVTNVLCGPAAPWTKDPNSLKQTINENEIDGKTLLNFGIMFSKQELHQVLGIRIARHKLIFEEEIVKLRSRSPLFKAWYQEHLRQHSLEADVKVEGSNRPTPALFTRESSHGDPRLTTLTNGQPDQVQAQVISSLEAIHPIPDQEQPQPEVVRPKKRQRIEPTKISLEPLSDESRSAYLGSGALSWRKIKSSRGEWARERIIDYGEGSFTLSLPNPWPTGQRLAVNQAMKQLLRNNSREENLLRRGVVRERSLSPSTDGDEEILDLADLPELDDETLREMEEEEAERMEYEVLNRAISKERAGQILDEEIKMISQRWRETKQQKYERKAFRIWKKAERSGKRTTQILEAQQRASEYDERCKKLITRILEQQWEKEADIRRQAGSLEQSVEDKMHKLWLIRLLESRVEPEKPPRTLTRRPAVRPQAADPTEEILYSTDEDDFVVQDEDTLTPPPRRWPTPTTNNGSRKIEIKSESQEFDGVTSQLHHEDRPSSRTADIVDLVTPPNEKESASGEVSAARDKEGAAAPATSDLAPSMENLEDFQLISNVRPDNFWGKKDDRWRLTIYMLAKLDFERRKAVYNLIDGKTGSEVWDTAGISYLANPLSDPAQIASSSDRRAEFDTFRILLSLIKCKFLREDRFAPLKPRDAMKLEKSGLKWIGRFCNFLREAESRFPDESQIYRPDQYDEELIGPASEALDGSQLPDDGTPRSHKTIRKEIVRDKAAVDLREREKKRNEDQEARRAKLLANLETRGNMSLDQTRLIINQSKEEDQSLIYIDKDISHRIKDHQIEGVRFMWNSLVVPPESRQGCLLSHTMGLGKTMQVITLLVAIAEAGESSDSGTSSQIPHDLRQPRTLILCPAGLVDNWMDELLKWAPRQALGSLSQLDALTPEEDRLGVIQSWAAEKGTLIVGYNMFKTMVETNKDAEQILLQKPTIVVADEAHMLKNPGSKTHIYCSRFSTKSRVALTGSPLANNVEEYYFMMDWIAPNFLGPLGEFRDIYSRNIECGLGIDSTQYERRRALKLLQALRELVAPKVHRATIASSGLLSELAPKREFVIAVPPTSMQRNLYKLYVDAVRDSEPMGASQMFSTINDLGLICNHPRCFNQQVLEIKKETSTRASFPKSIIGQALKETKVPDQMDKKLSVKVELLTIILDEARKMKDKVLVFSHSLKTLDYLLSLLQLQRRRVCRLDGSTAINKRQNLVKGFNTGDQEVYLISTTAGAVGLNIQGANRVVIFDSKWNPVIEQQAVGRAYRIGQEKPVFVYHLIVAGSFEQVMHKRAVFKTQLATRVIDSKHVVSWSNRNGEVIQHLQPVKQMKLDPFKGKDAILDLLIDHKHGSTGSILSIVSTDTFEELDPNFQLTAEEEAEAKQLITMNKLRLTNPREYDRLKAAQIRPQVPTMVPPPSQIGSQGIIPASNPAGSPQAGQVSSLPNNTQHVPMATPSPNGTPTTGHQEATHRSMEPIIGANTYIGSWQAGPPASNVIQAAPSTQSASASNSVPSIFSPDSIKQDKEIFTSVLRGRLAQVRSNNFPHLNNFPRLYRPVTEQAQSIAEAIHSVLKEQDQGFLIDNQQWRMIRGLLDSDRVVLAVATGYFNAKTLALAKKETLLERVKVIDSLSDKDFVAQLQRSAASPDPRVIIAHPDSLHQGNATNVATLESTEHPAGLYG